MPMDMGGFGGYVDVKARGKVVLRGVLLCFPPLKNSSSDLDFVLV